ncbi:MAG: hypothetical protein PHI18_09460, partial [bacterium]|nr:hypothetical protein [bacterium]
GNTKYSSAKLDNLMKCYRFFKELRNCSIHRGGIASMKCKEAFDAFQQVATTSDLGLQEVPRHHEVFYDQEIRVDLRGVVGFCDVIHRIMVTTDAELSRSLAAEHVFERRWREKHGTRTQMISQKSKKRHKQLANLMSRAGFPKAARTLKVYDFLRTKGWIF